MKSTFTTTQFLLILAVNVVFLLLIGSHYLSETVRTVHDQVTVTNTVYKDRTVQHCDATDSMMNLMQKAGQICEDNTTNRIASFHIDDKGNPVFDCK